MPRLLRRFLFALVLVSLCSAGGVLALDGYVRFRLGDLERIEGLPTQSVARLEPMNIVLVGSDDRAPVAGEESRFGTTTEVAGRRSDTILLARVDPGSRRVAVLSIPRDTYVPFSGGGAGRINEAYNQGGPQALIQAIADNLRIPVHHYVEVDFSGFRTLVEATGGVHLWIPQPVRDWDPAKGRSMTGLDLRDTGCVTLDGPTALAYVRSRYFQTMENGRWTADPTGDLGRAGRQQRFLLALAEAAAQRAAGGDPRVIDRLAREAIDLVRVDDGFTTGEIVRLGARFRGITAADVELLGPLPTTPFKGHRGAALLRIAPAAAAPLLARFGAEPVAQGVTKPAVPPTSGTNDTALYPAKSHTGERVSTPEAGARCGRR